jgi:hypothetical protein
MYCKAAQSRWPWRCDLTTQEACKRKMTTASRRLAAANPSRHFLVTNSSNLTCLLCASSVFYWFVISNTEFLILAPRRFDKSRSKFARLSFAYQTGLQGPGSRSRDQRPRLLRAVLWSDRSFNRGKDGEQCPRPVPAATWLAIGRLKAKRR